MREQIQEVEKFEAGKDDGTFFISYSDWRNIFDNLFICVNFDSKWHGKTITSQWNKEFSNGVVKDAKNP